MKRSYISGAAVALMAMFGLSAPASAQNLDLSEVGAALALPIVTGGSNVVEADLEADSRRRNTTLTSIVITNTSSSAIRLGVQVISGDRRDKWAANSFDCVLTGQETTQFFYTAASDGKSRVDFECSHPDATGDSNPDDLSIKRTEIVEAQTGIMWVYAQTISGQTSSNDVLVGDATVLDVTSGAAYSVNGIPFQGGDPLAQDGNLQFRFDGLEYAQFPSVLTTNFHAPFEARGFGVDADLILFTLDGTIRSETPRARLKVNFYNDDERHRDAAYEFDCFDIVNLERIDARFNAASLGSFVGHLELIPQPILYPNSAHDFLFDGPNVDNVRNVPVHGWLVQMIHANARADSGAEADEEDAQHMTETAAWGRNLNQGGFSLVPTVFDTPTLNAQ